MTVTLITGANKGIGFETAKQLLELGHTVYIGARDPEPGQNAAAALGARFVQLDVTDDASVSGALATIDADAGRLDVLVHNAGILETALDGPAALRAGSFWPKRAPGSWCVSRLWTPRARREPSKTKPASCPGEDRDVRKRRGCDAPTAGRAGHRRRRSRRD
jgi:NAD(P)-dependent dehydrogenase (short-subunit alcohol dehydrogenase family)